MSHETDRLLTADHAGVLLGLKTSTIWRLTYTQELPVVRPTGRRAVRYRLRDLEALIQMRSRPAGAAVRRGRSAPGVGQ